MALDIKLDAFTPCLVEASTGQLVDTVFLEVSQSELSDQLKDSWLFDWCSSELAHTSIYKLKVMSGNAIQGLVAITDIPSDQAVYVELAESAPHNKGADKKYVGVGGHLFAIGAYLSWERGYGGFFYLDAKNMELVKHYTEALGAILIGRPHPFRMVVDEDAADKLLKMYTIRKGGA